MKTTTAMDYRTNNTRSIKLLIWANRNNWLQIENTFYYVKLKKFQYQRLQLLIIQHLIQILLHQLLIIGTVLMHILHWLLVTYTEIKIQVQWIVYMYHLAYVLLIPLWLLPIRIIKFSAISMDIDSIQRNCDLIQVSICALPFDHFIRSIRSHAQFSLSIRHINNNMEIFVAFLVVFFIQSRFKQLHKNFQQFSVISQVTDVIFMYFNDYIRVFTVILFTQRKDIYLTKIHHEMQLSFMLHQRNLEQTIKEQFWHTAVQVRNMTDVDAMHILDRTLSKLRLQHEQSAKILHTILEL